jgi:hypothetical protein
MPGLEEQMRLDDEDIRTTGVGGAALADQGPADGGANQGQQDGGADSSADPGPGGPKPEIDYDTTAGGAYGDDAAAGDRDRGAYDSDTVVGERDRGAYDSDTVVADPDRGADRGADGGAALR